MTTEILAPTKLRPTQPPFYSGPHRFDQRLVIEALQEIESSSFSFEQPATVFLLLSNNNGTTWILAAFKTFSNGEALSKQTFNLADYRYEIPAGETCLHGWPPKPERILPAAKFRPPWTDYALAFQAPAAGNLDFTVSVSATASLTTVLIVSARCAH